LSLSTKHNRNKLIKNIKTIIQHLLVQVLYKASHLENKALF